jgi:translation initiation factor 1
MSAKKPRIDTNPVQGGFNAAFAKLDVPNLPEGPADVSTQPPPVAPVRLGRVVLRKEKAHRGGKTVIVVHGFEPQVATAMIEEVARELRTACGAGGTVEDRTIVMQGDQPDRIRAVLVERGFRVAGV